MKIHPLTTGTVRIKQVQHRGVGTGLRRRSAMFRAGAMTGDLPIHFWAIEHDDGLVLVDAGESSAARDQRFATFAVDREDELDHRLAAAGLEAADVTTVVLTHIHGDHVGGLPHVPRARVLAGAAEIRFAASVSSRLARRALRQPLPAGFAPAPLALDGPAFGAFAASTPITADGRIVAVPAPGHTPGHVAVVVVRDHDHVLLAGDAAYDLPQLLDRHVDGISPDEAVARATMDTILAHARRQPTIVLPSHDRASAARLAAGEPVAA